MNVPRKYRRKPTEGLFIEFHPHELHSLPHLPELLDKEWVRSIGGRWQVWNGKHESWINVDVGDFIRVDDPDDFYPVARDTFEATYELVVDDGGA